ncbi:thioesterase II family protein [Streptomyces tubercidicus]|uniref:Pyochelin biosynthetic protein PchC n=1 Tax=Streptomyces tubercidicus TaxID=47759 RepID=A0A640UJA7_9ACTN|nr:alpha/beta fold hydrolase [Streptomyces tubercidicus]WAU10615.1 alpha/beta fold hydrolase [Streptomyces tubercidicus]GFE35739.1 pyochelin biosynthetic protein PchC [Streptomyces tubercidicus]
MGAQQLLLACLPFAGSGAGFFREWEKLDVSEVAVLPVQLPGREERFLDDPFTEVGDAVAELTPRIVSSAGEGADIALFGHSLGAVLAYEIARELERTGHLGLRHLFVSGSPGPHNGRTERATGLADEEFLAGVQRFAGYRHAAFDDPELVEVLLPTLRADVQMHEDYRATSTEPLSVPITALRGEDDELVSREQAEQWAKVTRGPFAYRELPNGHMYLVDEPERLLRVIAGSPACG